MNKITKIMLASFAAMIVCSLQQRLIARDRDDVERIKSDLVVCGNADFKSDVTVEGNLDVVGDTSTRDLTVRRNFVSEGTSTVQGLTVNGNLAVTGTTTSANQTVTNLSVTGAITQPVTVSSSGEAGPVASVGDVLVVSSTADGQVERSSSANQTSVVGVATSNVAADGTVNMALAGQFQVKVVGSVGRGNFLVTSGQAGVAQAGTGNNAFAVATGTVADNGSVQLVTARYIVADTF